MDRVLIIAEAGINHNGSLETAKKMADAARESGADIVKFQTADLGSLVTDQAPLAGYQKENMGSVRSQKEMLKDLLLSHGDFIELADHCREIGIRFLSTPFDVESVAFLSGIGCGIWKIPSGEITDLPYLVKVAQMHQPIILSTGMSSMEEVAAAMAVLRAHGADDMTLLHCTTAYPAPYEDVGLRAMMTLRERFGVPVGYSDHTLGIEVPIAAVGMGACVIEKHFTLDRSMKGPDHKASLEPGELKAMVSAIRNIELALGTGVKAPAASEIVNMAAARKSIVAAVDIRKGERFTEKNLTTKRPGTGISPMRWDSLIGMTAERDYRADEMIQI